MRHTTKTKFRRLRVDGLTASREHSAVRSQLSRLRRADRVSAAAATMVGLESRISVLNTRAMRLAGA